MPIGDKDARRKYNQEWYEKNKERVREYRAKYYQAHKVQGQTYAREWRENNKEYKSEREHKHTLRKQHNMTPDDPRRLRNFVTASKWCLCYMWGNKPKWETAGSRSRP